jgi:hypothetical protein
MSTEADSDGSRDHTHSKPLLFISHRHADREIADAVRQFITERSGGRIAVFQSSSAEADDRPQVGRELQQELKHHLWEATVVVLIYTGPEEDWSYCMWECGVATLEAPETRIIVLQCGSQPPQVYSDAVRVKAQDLTSVQNFVSEFLTSEGFFPDYGEAIAPGFSSSGSEVEQAAQQLFHSLQELVVEDADGEDWTTVPFMRLQLTFAEVDHIKEMNMEEAEGEVLRAARVVEIDDQALRLFGLGRVEPTEPLTTLVEAWQERRTDAKSDWIADLATQVKDGSRWRYPQFRWQLLSSANRTDRAQYAPVVSRVRSVPRQRVHQFDVYFNKFDTDDDGALRIGFVDEPQVQAPMESAIGAIRE